MKLSAADFGKLQYSLLAALLMLAIGGLAVYFALDATTTATRQRQAAQAERDDAERKLQRVRLEESNIREKSLVFNQLQARGVIGDEHRLEWVELLKAIRQRRQTASNCSTKSPRNARSTRYPAATTPFSPAP